MVNGLSISQYTSDLSDNQQALSVTIAECMDGVSPENIINLVAVGATPSVVASQLRAERRVLSSSDAISISYQVQTNEPGLSYSTLSSQLSSAVSLGTFTQLLQSNAGFYGAGDMSSATSTSVATVNESPSSGSSSGSGGLSGGAIAGIVIALLAVILGGAAYWFLVVKANKTPETNTIQQIGVTPAVELQETNTKTSAGNIVMKIAF